MKTNPFYAIWGIVSLLLIGGAAIFLFISRSAFKETENTFDEKEATIENLAKKKPHPDNSGLKAISELHTEYKGVVDELYESLANFQHPLNMELRAEDFQKLVLDKKRAFESAAAKKGMEVKISDGADFYFGMDRYASIIPASEIVPLLNYQLEAIDRLLTLMLDSGVGALVELERELLHVENNSGGVDPDEGKPVIRYALKVRFVADHPALQKFINSLANDDEFFFLLRVLRIDNSSPEGVAASAADDGPFDRIPVFSGPDGEAPPQEILAEISDMSIDEMTEHMVNLGYSINSGDAKVLFGEEKLRVFAVIDVARFPTEEERKSSATDDNSARK
jgi:hypothetical protein